MKDFEKAYVILEKQGWKDSFLISLSGKNLTEEIVRRYPNSNLSICKVTVKPIVEV